MDTKVSEAKTNTTPMESKPAGDAARLLVEELSDQERSDLPVIELTPGRK